MPNCCFFVNLQSQPAMCHAKDQTARRNPAAYSPEGASGARNVVSKAVVASNCQGFRGV